MCAEYDMATFPPEIAVNMFKGTKTNGEFMSVTVSDLLKLPSMHNAEVVAGKGGLDKIVSSVSVLETVNPELIDTHVNKDMRTGGGEIVITSFINAVDDEEIQFRNVCQLEQSGEVGIIVYYVGVFLKRISQKILDYADEKDFVVICMPENQEKLRYSDAISDIMSAVIHDRDRNEPLVVTLLDTIARLPANKRSANTMIRLISERIHASLILTDENDVPVYEAAWPGEYAGISHSLTKSNLLSVKNRAEKIEFVPEGYIQHRMIRYVSGNLKLFVISIGKPLEETLVDKAAEAVRISVNIWEQRDKGAQIRELVRAILDDDPLRMRSLAALFMIDIAAINTMWIFKGNELNAAMAKALSDYAGIYCSTSFADLYGDEIILFTSAFDINQDVREVYEQAASILSDGFIAALFTNLKNTTDVRKSYILYNSEADDAGKILPGRRYYSGEDLSFARSCRETIESGEEAVQSAMSGLSVFEKLRDSDSMIETLSIFLLDADQGVQRTAERLFVHKNTVKYRLKMMSNCVGYRIGAMPATYGLYKAVGIKRLIRT